MDRPQWLQTKDKINAHALPVSIGVLARQVGSVRPASSLPRKAGPATKGKVAIPEHRKRDSPHRNSKCPRQGQ